MINGKCSYVFLLALCFVSMTSWNEEILAPLHEHLWGMPRLVDR
jgi:hypothetical protein